MKTTEPVMVYIGEDDAREGELTCERHDQRMWAEGPRPDPKWTYTDAAGHAHVRGEDGESLPTLNVEWEHFPCDGACGDSGCDGWDVPHYTCPTCGEDIIPGVIEGPYQFTVEGMWSWQVKVKDWFDGDVNDEVPMRLAQVRDGVERAGRGVVTNCETGNMTGVRYAVTELVGISELSGAASS